MALTKVKDRVRGVTSEAELIILAAANAPITLGANITLTQAFSPTIPYLDTNGYIFTLGANNIGMSNVGVFLGTPGCFNYNSTGVVTGLKYAEPEWWGSGADDSTYVQYAATCAASGGGTLALHGDYTIADVIIPNGVKCVDGKGGSITGTGSAVENIIELSATTDDCILQNLSIDMSGGDPTAIELKAGASNNTIKNCHLYGFTTPSAASRFAILGGAGCDFNIIADNTIEMHESSDATWTSNAISFFGTTLDYGGFFTTPTDASVPCTGNVISNNTVIYGEVAVDLIGCENTTIEGNNFYKQQTRAIYIINSSNNNLISNNNISGFVSSAVVLGYSSHHNTVVNNDITQIAGYNSSGGVAAIYLSIGPQYNLIQNNRINSFTYFGIFGHVNLTGNVIDGNYIQGHAKCAIALDSDYESLPHAAEALTSFTSYGAPPSGTQWASANSEFNVISNNTIGAPYSTSAGYGIGLAQLTQSGETDYYLRYNTIKNNVINNYASSGAGYNNWPYRFYEASSGYLTDNILIDNHSPGVILARWYATRDRNHFSDCRGNDAWDFDTVTFADADATPSVGKGGYFKTANTGATNITAFDDTFDGQVFSVLLDANTTVVHGGAQILKSSANISGAVNYIVTFQRRGAVTYEIARNF